MGEETRKKTIKIKMHLRDELYNKDLYNNIAEGLQEVEEAIQSKLARKDQGS